MLSKSRTELNFQIVEAYTTYRRTIVNGCFSVKTLRDIPNVRKFLNNYRCSLYNCTVLLLGFLVSKEAMVLRWWPESETKIWLYQNSRLRLNYHREKFRKLTFGALALRQSEKRNCGVLLVITDLKKKTKEQVLHRVRLHLNVPGWLTDLNAPLTRKLVILLSRFNVE